MSSYDFLAGCYDRLTYDVDYSAWADYIEKHFAKAPLPGRTVLDLACGTGSLTRELALRGYEMIGADQSPEMLAEAAEKPGRRPHRAHFPVPEHGEAGPLRHHRRLRVLPGQRQLRHRPQKLARAFQRVHLFLMPGGLFLFDVNTPEKLAGLDGQVFLDETEDAYCVWRAEFSRRICTYFMDIFRLDPSTGQWDRGEELHRERAYTVEELTTLLEGAGFVDVQTWGERKLRPPRPGEQRIFFTARKDT